MTVGWKLPSGKGICYSGYREGQSPLERVYPSHEQIHEDLLILKKNWRLLRLFDSGPHAQRVLEVMTRHRLPFQVLLGAWLGAEANNPACPWGTSFSERELAANRRDNEAEIGRLIALAAGFRERVFAVAVGSQTSVDWTDRLVPLMRMIEYLRRVRQAVAQPVTCCENYVPWQNKLHALVPELDFISLHSYPVWEARTIHEAIAYTGENFQSVARMYPDKPVVITEAGWPSNANGIGIKAAHATQQLQDYYYRDLMDWSRETGVPSFVFEAFDEAWKGSSDPQDAEKHWGLFGADRRPKQVMLSLYPELVPAVAGVTSPADGPARSRSPSSPERFARRPLRPGRRRSPG